MMTPGVIMKRRKEDRLTPLTRLERLEVMVEYEKRIAELTLRYENQTLELKLLHERSTRELTQQYTDEARDNAEKYIREKTEAHNGLLQKMERDATMYVTKDQLTEDRKALRGTIQFWITVSGFGIMLASVGLNLMLRILFPVAAVGPK